MADVTVAQFAEVLKVPVDRLLQQLDQAGIKVDGAEDMISEDAKHELLTHLRRSHGHDESQGDAAPRKITLKRKSQSELKLASSQGRARTVNVEVRSKRTYVKREVLEDQARHQQEEIDRLPIGVRHLVGGLTGLPVVRQFLREVPMVPKRPVDYRRLELSTLDEMSPRLAHGIREAEAKREAGRRCARRSARGRHPDVNCTHACRCGRRCLRCRIDRKGCRGGRAEGHCCRVEKIGAGDGDHRTAATWS